MREMGEVSFHFIGTNGLEVENERFSFVARAVVRTSNSISSRHRLADYVKKKKSSRELAARAARLFPPYSTNHVSGF